MLCKVYVQAAKVLKDFSIQQLSVSWRSNAQTVPSKSSSMESDSWHHVTHPVSGNAKAIEVSNQQEATDPARQSLLAETSSPCHILPPTNCDLRVSMKTDKHNGVMRLGAVALLERLQLQVNKEQLADIAWLQDQFAVWALRNQHAPLRPTGWRSSDKSTVSARYSCCTSPACHVVSHGFLSYCSTW